MINMRKIGIVRDNVRSISLGDIFKISHVANMEMEQAFNMFPCYLFSYLCSLNLYVLFHTNILKIVPSL